MNGPQHFAAAQHALANAEEFSGPDSDRGQFETHMRLHEAHLYMAQLALRIAKSAAAGELADDTSYSGGKRERSDALFQNYTGWIAAITDGEA